MKTPCFENHEQCPYKNRSGCYSDTDHQIPRFMAKGASALVRNYIRTPANQQQLCRFEHDQKSLDDLMYPPELPSERVMIGAIMQARRDRK